VECKVGLTGFKWIAKMIKDFPEQQFVGGGEESFGYMVGDFVRDKDAVTATLLACEIAAQQKEKNSSVYQYLQELFLTHGMYKEHLISLVKKGQDGAAEIKKIMNTLRANLLKKIAGSKVVRIDDYASGKSQNVITGSTEKIEIPKSNVLIYTTEDGSRIAARPSGTEPKIKFYISVNQKVSNTKNTNETLEKLEHKLQNITTEMQLG